MYLNLALIALMLGCSAGATMIRIVYSMVKIMVESHRNRNSRTYCDRDNSNELRMTHAIEPRMKNSTKY